VGDASAADHEIPEPVIAAALATSSTQREANAPAAPAWLGRFVWQTLWKIATVGLLVAALLYAGYQAKQLIAMLVVSTFFAIAMVPGVNGLHKRFGMRRGAAVGIIYFIAVVGVAFFIIVFLPAVNDFAQAIRDSASEWFASLNAWAQANVGGASFNEDAAAQSQAAADALANWAAEPFGVVRSGIGLIFDMFTIAAFTFYIAADFPRIMRALMTRMPPERQRVFSWITETSIQQTGGYFYSRLLLMIVCGGLGLIVMLIGGMPLIYALPLAVFMGFVSEFIPFIGTYLGVIIPAIFMLAIQGWPSTLLLIGWVIIYQQLENFVLSPRVSSQTMELTGAVAFGAALAGGAIFGPLGAFMALPVAALITAVVKNTGKTYEVVHEIESAGRDEENQPREPRNPRMRSLRSRFSRSREEQAAL
jgi:predicted PurR-regulated permease PerM